MEDNGLGQRQAGSASPTRRLAWRVLAVVLLVGLVVLLFVFFRPQSLGGSTEYVEAHGISMTPTIHDGDVVVVKKQASYQVGDVVAYRIPAGQPGAGEDVVRRIAGGNGASGFVTKGDHNSYTDPWHPKTADVVGKAWFRVSRLLRWVLIVVAGVAVVILVIAAWPRRRRQPPPDVPAGPTSAAGQRIRPLARAGAPGPRRPSTTSAASGALAERATPTRVRELEPAPAVEPNSVDAVSPKAPVAPTTPQRPAPLAGAPTDDAGDVASPMIEEPEPESVAGRTPGDSYWKRSRRGVGGLPPGMKRRPPRPKDTGPKP
jgi:signal peptidase